MPSYGAASYKAKKTCAFWARRLAVSLAALAISIGLGARPAKATPFAYVTNSASNNVSAIDTAANPPRVVATVGVGLFPAGVAVTPDGQHVYVANGDGTVAVIPTASNRVVATVPNGGGGFGAAVTPDGTHVYVATGGNTVSVIATASNTVVAMVSVGNEPSAVAVTPDGSRAYVTNYNSNNVSVIDTAINKVVATIPVGDSPFGVAVTPDGTHVYVTNSGGNTVSVLATASNTVVAAVTVDSGPTGVAITPDGAHVYVSEAGVLGTVKVIATASNTVVTTIIVGSELQAVALTPDGAHAYVTNLGQNTVSVIDTASNSVAATVAVGSQPARIGIVPPPHGIPFAAFSAKLEIHFGYYNPRSDDFNLNASFTLGSASNGINPPAEAVTIKVGTFTTTIPPGTFKGQGFGPFHFEGVIHGVRLVVMIQPTGAKRFTFHAVAHNANLAGTTNPVPVTLERNSG